MKYKKFFVFLIVSLLSLSMFAPVAFAASEPEDNSGSVSSDQPLYFSCYELMRQYIYGSDTELTEHMDLTLTILSTICSLFLVGIPFVVVFFVIRLVTGR